jgi:hypothetical protein
MLAKCEDDVAFCTSKRVGASCTCTCLPISIKNVILVDAGFLHDHAIEKDGI